MLELLSLRKGMTLTKEMFLNHLYGGMDEPELKIIDVFICKMRKKLAKASSGKNYIETVWGVGYILREPIEKRDQTHSVRGTLPPHCTDEIASRQRWSQTQNAVARVNDQFQEI